MYSGFFSPKNFKTLKKKKSHQVYQVCSISILVMNYSGNTRGKRKRETENFILKAND